MKKGRFWGVWLVGLGLLTSTPDAGAETEAEEAAQSQRPLTAAEISQREADCALPTSGEQLTGTPPEIRAVRIEISKQDFVGLFIFDGTVKDKVLKATEVFPELPMGGIGDRDVCSSAVAGIMPTHPSNTKSVLMTWRLRPGLDLAADYPTAAAQISQNRQILPIPASGFALIKFEHATQASGIVAQLANWDMVEPNGYYFFTNDKLYVPLRE